MNYSVYVAAEGPEFRDAWLEAQTRALLENMGQLMAEQLLSLDAVGVVISRSEVNV